VLWGVDGCRGGWLAIGLSIDDAAYEFGVYESLHDIWQTHQSHTQRLLIDSPIGLLPEQERNVEAAARRRIPGRSSSVFSVPTRRALELAHERDFASDAYSDVCDLNQQLTGKRFSRQTWHILPRIHEVDAFLQQNHDARNTIYEAHPEVLFASLNTTDNLQPMRYSKKKGIGFYERVQILQQYRPDAFDIIQTIYDTHKKQLVDDDIVDALVCAVSATFPELRTIPASPQTDTTGLPMQIVYPAIN
jgi:predicted RNase H-like nuclease